MTRLNPEWQPVGEYVTPYRPGDTISGECLTAGFVTGEAKTLFFVIPLLRPVDGSLSVQRLSVTVRANGGYPLSGNTSWSFVSASVTGGAIQVHANVESAMNTTNNSAVGIEAYYSFKVT